MTWRIAPPFGNTAYCKCIDCVRVFAYVCVPVRVCVCLCVYSFFMHTFALPRKIIFFFATNYKYSVMLRIYNSERKMAKILVFSMHTHKAISSVFFLLWA